MAFLFGLFGSKPVAPERVPTDSVVPLFERDDTTTNRNVTLEFTMKFDEVLDAEKLSGALWKLLERPGWRKLGARLRLDAKGKLEYHIPAQYTKERPPINYTHIIEAMPISKHPLGPKFPKPNGKLQCFDDLGRVIVKSKTNPEFFADYISADIAQLGLQIVRFDDATLVTITWLHTLLDAMGRHALLRAWTAVLEGRDNDVPEFLGYDTDPLSSLGTTELSQQEDFVKEPSVVKSLGMARFIFNFLWEAFFYPDEESRLVCMPASYFSKLKAQAFIDLDSLPPADLTYNNDAAEGKKPFLSDGDIVTAWLMRLIASTNPTITASSPTRLITIMNVFGMRDVLRTTSPPLLSPTGAYIHNCATAIWSHFSLSEFLSLPLGHVAARIRKDLVTQSTRAQVEAGVRAAKAHGGMALYGTGNMVLSVMTNWSKAKLFETDFSAAIVDGKVDGKSESGKTRGKPRFIHVYTTRAKGFPLRGNGNCVGRDAQGNLWFGTILRKGFGEGFRKAVDGMS